MNPIMEHLKQIHHDMTSAGENAVIFPVTYNRKPFSCVFSILSVPYTLYITMLGSAEQAHTLCLNIQESFSPPTYLGNNDYKAMAQYLNFGFNISQPFRPFNFFLQFDQSISPQSAKHASVSTVMQCYGKVHSGNDSDKPYFCGWKRNPEGKSVTPENFERTKAILPLEQALVCKRLNISSCWASYPSQERLAEINQKIFENAF